MVRNAVFAIVSVLLLLGNLAATGTSSRERAKRAVCLANLRQLTAAWSLYADQNDGRIVNGAAGFHFFQSGGMTSDASYPGVVEKAWIGRGWRDNYASPSAVNDPIAEAQQKRAIREGALWPLIRQDGCYKCPLGRTYEVATYSIVDAMNGMYRTGTATGATHVTAVGVKIGETVLWIKRLAEIVTPPPSRRMVFIDEGAMTPDSFAVNYNWRTWWDNPPARHNDGTTVSWADGHSSYLQWKGADTIAFGREHRDYYGGGSFTPQTLEGIKDLQNFQIAVWGRLGYE